MLDENDAFDEEENLIAIVGMVGRFPQANSVREFWNNLVEEKECIQTFSEVELVLAGVELGMVRHPKYVKASASIENIDQFDADFFGINPAEAALLDPQHRFFLECVWHALEDAACDPDRFDGRIGVYAGCALSSYLIKNLLTNPEETAKLGATQAHMSNDKDFLPTRVSYLLNLTGPSVSVGTACSTSLVAVHQAVQSLLNFESDLALAGGVSIRANQTEGHLYQESGILSPDGHCRPFDAKAQGTIVGSGVGVVALKRLAEAVENRDPIYAVLRGSSINNDGQVKVGFTAPSLSGQAEVITEAQAVAGIDANEIGYVEAHGTGTVLGDPIEVAALTQAFSASESEEKLRCAIGSLKSNMGHLDSAAGVAGLIKASLCVKEAMIPASLHYHQPNPKINFEDSPFFVNKETKAWSDIPDIYQARRIAAVSSFGIGGTNAHVIVEEAPQLDDSQGADDKPQMLLLSAKSTDALQDMRANLARYLNEEKANLQDVAFTLQTGRKALEKRHFLYVKDRQDAIDLLHDNTTGTYASAAEDVQVVFLFSGQGSQYYGMARELYQASVPFKETFDACADYLQSNFDIDLTSIVFEASDPNEINQTKYTQPVLFSLEYSLAKTLESWGVNATAMIGHSIGEYVAATLSGVFSLEDALTVVSHRGRLMQSCLPGSMLSVESNIDDVQKWVGGAISLAAHNSKVHCVLSGPTAEIQQLANTLEKQKIPAKLLKTSHAFHSHMMEPILNEFENVLDGVALKLPNKSFISNVSGDWISNDQATNRKYWVSQLRSAVLFADGVEKISQQLENPLWIEVGPGRALTSLVRANGENSEQQAGINAINCLPHATEKSNSYETFCLSLARAWGFGIDILWDKWHEEKVLSRIQLPHYPFQRKSYWVEPGEGMSSHRLSIMPEEKWNLMPSWKRVSLAAPVVSSSEEEATTIVLSCGDDFSNAFIRQLKESHQHVIEVSSGSAFDDLGEDKFSINFSQEEDYLCLFESIGNRKVRRVFHLLNTSSDKNSLDELKEMSFYSPLFLLKAMKEAFFNEDSEIVFVSRNAQNVTGSEVITPERAMLTGPVLVGGIECNYTNISWVDLDDNSSVKNLMDEIGRKLNAHEIAYRNGIRWEKCFADLSLKPENVENSILKQNGTYILTGGLGGMGLAFAELLASEFNANIILTGRREIPEVSRWENIENDSELDVKTQKLIGKLNQIKKKANHLVYLQCDVTSEQGLQGVVDYAHQHCGDINGVIHAAGVPGGGLLGLKNRQEVEDTIAPKVKGSLAVIKALQNEKALDFVVFCSSLSAQVGVLGQIDYSAANAFQDALAQSLQLPNDARCISIGWDGWRESGMAVDTDNPLAEDAGLEIGVSNDEGKRQLLKILDSGLTHVMVSTIDWDKRRQEIQKHHEDAKQKQRQNKEGGERPDLSTVYVEPSDEIEKTLANLLSELLFIRPIGVLDDFFELGGHSLIAVNFCSRASEQLQVEVTVADFFEQPTISSLSQKIATKKLEQMGEDEVESMLAEIESLSDSDIQDLLDD